MGAENGLTQTMKNGRNQNTEMLERLLPKPKVGDLRSLPTDRS